MKFSKLRQLILVSSIGLLVATLLTACSITTIDYVYVASSSGIQTFAVDSESGALRSVGAVVSGGVNLPVAMVTTPDYANLYVANQGDGTIVHFAIGLNGELTKQDSITIQNGTLVSLAINSAGTYLYVLSGPGPSFSPAGAIGVFPLGTNGAIGSAITAPMAALEVPGYNGDTIIPTGITVLANNGTDITGNAVYVSAYDQSAYNPGCTPTPPATTCTPSTANPGWVFGFTIGSDGALTAASNSPWQAGIKPTAIASDPTDRFVYVTDYASNDLIGYTILDGSTLSYMTTGPFKTGNEPSAITIDPRGVFIYVTNALDSTVSAYSIVQSTGNPTAAVNVTGSPFNTTDAEPVAVAVDPALGRFVYTANELGNSVSGFRLNPTSGSLSATQATPYPTDSKPTALVVIPHGNHATAAVAP